MSTDDALVTLLLVAPAVLGFAIGRWWFMLVVLSLAVFWPLATFLEDDVGEFAYELAIATSLIWLVTAGLAIAARKGLRRIGS